MGISLRKRHFASLGALVAAATVALAAAAQTSMQSAIYLSTAGGFVGVDADKTSQWSYGPDGAADGHWQIRITGTATIESLDLYALDANGNKTIDHWSTKDPRFFLLAVEANGQPVNTGHVDTLGAFPVDTVLDLYGSQGQTQFGAQNYELDIASTAPAPAPSPPTPAPTPFCLTPTAQACVEKWIAEAMPLLNSYQGSPDFNARKPWAINQYGILEGQGGAGPTSVAAPDDFSQYYNNKTCWMLGHYTAVSTLQWQSPEWRGAGVPPLICTP